MIGAPDVIKIQKIRYGCHAIKEYDPFFSLKHKK